MDFVNAHEMRAKYGSGFHVPSKKDLDNLKISDTVKVCNGRERFWTIITNINEYMITATVDNHLVFDGGYNLGDTINFKKCNIYDISPDYITPKMKALLYS